MEANLIIYPSANTSGDYQDSIEEKLEALDFTHYASQLMGKGFEDEKDLSHAIYKAIEALAVAGMPVHRHFRCIYICEDGQLKLDFLVTDLGFRLIIVHADAANPVAARLQVETLLHHQL